MSTIKLGKDVEVTVSNCGIIVFYKNGEACSVHPYRMDTTKLVKFLIKSGYNFVPKKDKGR